MDSQLPEIDPLQSAKAIIEETSVNLFLTGKAGTGKTTFLHSLSQATGKRHVVLASTGVAAINAGGSTIHSFFQLNLAPFIPGHGYISNESERYQRFGRDKLKMIRTLDLIIIDEISMVRPDVLDAMDHVLRRLRNSAKPFGGVQLLLIGDLRQLAPVAQNEEWQFLKDYYASPYFFESHALKEAGFLMVELTHVYRQSDPVFVEILNKIRDNRADTETLAQLNRRAGVRIPDDEKDSYIRLTTHNYRANQINSDNLDLLESQTITFRAKISGDFPESTYPAEPELVLKQGAKVMFIKNDISGTHEYYNGMLGEVISLSDSEVVVRPLERKSSINVEPVVWERIKYSLSDSGEIKTSTEGSFEQLPLRLAWAITIHKSQGLTFDKAIVDATHSFASGQTYVALSRCRSLDGLVLESPIPPSAIKTDPAVNSFIECHPRMAGSEKELDLFRESYQAEMLAELFDFRTISNDLDQYYRAVASTLGKDFPKFADATSLQLQQFRTQVTDVASRLYSFFRNALPRGSEPATAELLRQKISGGAAYFAARIRDLLDHAKSTPLNIDNKALRKRLMSATDSLAEALDLKLRLLDIYRDREFDPQDYIRNKTKILLATPGLHGSVSTKESIARPSSPYIADRQERKPVSPADIQNPDLYRRLCGWRSMKAGDRPAFTVLSNRMLMEISAKLPATPNELKSIPGIGPMKMRLYADEIVEIVNEYIGQH